MKKENKKIRDIWCNGVRKYLIVCLSLLCAVAFGLGVSNNYMDKHRERVNVAEDTFKEAITFENGNAYFESDKSKEIKIGNRGYSIYIEPDADLKKVSSFEGDGWYFGKDSFVMNVRGDRDNLTYVDLENSLSGVGIYSLKDFNITDYYYDNKVDFIIQSLLIIVTALSLNMVLLWVVFLDPVRTSLGLDDEFVDYEDTFIGLLGLMFGILIVQGMTLWWLNLYVSLVLMMVLLMGVVKIARIPDHHDYTMTNND